MLEDIKYKNGFFYIGLVLSGLVLVMGILAFLTVFGFAGGRSSALFIVTMGGTTPLLFCTYWLFNKGLGEKAMVDTAGKIIKRDFSYLGLVHCDYYLNPYPEGTKESIDFYFSQMYVFSSTRLQEKNSVLKQALFYSKIPRKANLNSKIYVQKNKLVFDTMGYSSKNTSYMLDMLKLEQSIIKDMKKQKTQVGYNFSEGLPLATYLILSAGNDKQIERALFFKKQEMSPLKTHLINYLSPTYEDMETYVSLPESWLLKMKNNQIETNKKAMHVNNATEMFV